MKRSRKWLLIASCLVLLFVVMFILEIEVRFSFGPSYNFWISIFVRGTDPEHFFDVGYSEWYRMDGGTGWAAKHDWWHPGERPNSERKKP